MTGRQAGPHGQVPDGKLVQATGLIGEPLSEAGERPVRTGRQPGACDPQRQRQASALPGDLAGRAPLLSDQGCVLAESIVRFSSGIVVQARTRCVRGAPPPS